MSSSRSSYLCAVFLFHALTFISVEMKQSISASQLEMQAVRAHLSSAAVAPGMGMLLLRADTRQKLKLLFFIVMAAQQSCLGNSETECCDRLMVFS